MTRLIERIKYPADLKKFSRADLPLIADEVRDEILRTVCCCGGHLASSLGTVEITIALHYVFNAPDDLIVWDVGHQAYAHKILTGRREAFPTLRQKGGISGFPRRDESCYDCYGAGHASTSISAALGMVAGLENKGDERRRVIAVIGDGGLTGGMALEALNHAGHLGKDLIVILNDNEMSIHPNVGALSAFLSRKMTANAITRMQSAVRESIKSLPSIGDEAFKVAKRFKDALKNFISPGYLFEGLGFTYVGPINGHRMEELIETLENVQQLREGPILIHARTVKGRGYEPAENQPVTFHGVGPFERKTGKIKKKPAGAPSYTRVFSDALIELAETDERVVAITAAMPNGTGLDRFMEKFPKRCYDVGIAEQHAVGFAAGLATQGMRPVVAIYSTFLQRAYDQIVHDVCLQNLPVLFAIDRAGIVGADGPTHHGSQDLSYLRHIPNMAVMAPADEDELRRMLAAGLAIDGPCAIRYPRGNAMGAPVSVPIKPLEFGRAEIKKQGKDMVFMAVGNSVYPALAAAQKLEKDGLVDGAVINVRFVKPLDKELLCGWAMRTGRVLTIEENVAAGGFGSAVLEMFQEEGVEAKIRRVALPDRFIEHGAPDELRAMLGLDADGIAHAALGLMGKTQSGRRAAFK